jgi:hypothetical protein
MRRSLDRLSEAYAASVGATSPGAAARAEEIVIRTAFHEAAHTIVGALARLRPHFATIERGSPSPNLPAGWGFVRWTTPSLQLAGTAPERQAMWHLAGHVMEAIRDPEHAVRDRLDLAELLESAHYEEGGAGDVSFALAAITPLVPDEGRRWRRLLSLAQQTETMLRRPKVAAAVERVAEALLDRGTVEGDALLALLPGA